MPDLETAARQEAERRYPVPEDDGWGFVAHDREVFAAGARWGVEQADAALTKALGQRDAVAVTAERMTSYARQAEAVLREVAALHGRYFDIEKGPGDYEASPEPEDIWRFDRDLRAILARTQQTGADR